jgi:imidazoleglycerol-phosphate dehydratase
MLRRVGKPARRAVAMRKADVKRETKETQISVSLDLDGSGRHDVASGVGFLDHMLEQLARHGLIDLKLRAQGDLHIDMHHTAEDVGIVIGQAVARALGERRGIRRFSSVHLAMDEALTRVVIDVSGRPYLVWKVALPRAKLGDFDTELVREWFHAFAQNAGITLHVETLYGDNTHHIVETCFKGLARALREAVAIDERAADAVPSTKGTLAGEVT